MRASILIVAALSAQLTQAQSSLAPTPPAPGTDSFRIAVPKELRKTGTKLRVRNSATGQSRIVDLGDEDFITSDQVRALWKDAPADFKPEFSVLDVESRRPLPPPRATGSRIEMSRSLVFDQPVWRQVGFTPRRTKKGKVVFALDPKAGAVIGVAKNPTVTNVPSPTADEASRRRGLREGGDVRKLFDIGWRAISLKRYDLGVVAFDRLLRRRESLDAEQLSQAHLGLGISMFHQKGCGAIEPDFRAAEGNPANLEDIRYYRGLCAVEGKQWKLAAQQFGELVRSNSAKYGESSRFFLGLVAENEERFDEAESAYLDTIDFSSDARLVSLAKTRLENVRALRAQRELESKWLTVAGTLGTGYDSNVVGLPQSLSPADYSLTNEASASWLGLFHGEVKPPWTRAVDWKLEYTYLTLNYLSDEIREDYDIQSHEVGTSVGFQPTASDRIGLGVSYNSVFKGPRSTSGEYLGTTNFEVRWQEVHGDDPQNPTSDSELSFKTSLVRPRFVAASDEFDSYVNAYTLSYRHNFQYAPMRVFAPGLDLEYRPAKGSEVSYYSATALSRWDIPVGPDAWALSLSQEGAIQYTPYYQSVEDRKDLVVRYTGSVARLWGSWFETRLQVIGTVSMSTVPSGYRYNKGQINLLLSAFY